MVALTPSLGKQRIQGDGSDFNFRQFRRKSSSFHSALSLRGFPWGVVLIARFAISVVARQVMRNLRSLLGRDKLCVANRAEPDIVRLCA